MARDWSARTAALAYFEKELKLSKRFNEDDTAHMAEAVNALRRSEDHTAIQKKLTAAMLILRNVALCANEGSGLCQPCRDSIAKFVQQDTRS